MDRVEAALDAEIADLFTMLKEIHNGPTDGKGRTYHPGNRINPMFDERMYEWYEIWKAVMGVCELRAAGAKKMPSRLNGMVTFLSILSLEII